MDNEDKIFLTNKDYWRPYWRKKRKTQYPTGLPWFDDCLSFQDKHLPPTKGRSLLEVGCAASRWLPVYVSHYGYEVFGIDYDRQGCDLAIEILEKYRQQGQIYCGEFFNYASTNKDRFDIITSFGFIEHFKDNLAVESMYKCLKPDGVVVATVPNFQGFQGFIFQLMEDWQSTHVLYTTESIKNAFEKAGFIDVDVQYAGGLGLPVPRPQGWRKLLFPIHGLMWILVIISYLFCRYSGLSFHGKNTASSIMIAGRKPSSHIGYILSSDSYERGD